MLEALIGAIVGAAVGAGFGATVATVYWRSAAVSVGKRLRQELGHEKAEELLHAIARLR